jgi:hypothetical protein
MQNADRDQNKRSGRTPARRAADAPDRELQEQSEKRRISRLSNGPTARNHGGGDDDQREHSRRHFDTRRRWALRPTWQRRQ